MTTITTPLELEYSESPHRLAENIVKEARQDATNYIRVKSTSRCPKQRQIEALDDCIRRLERHIAALLAEKD